MARIRYLKPDFFFDEDIATLSFKHRLAFQGLWCYADREGILEDTPKRLKALIFPYDNIDMDIILKELTNKPFIHRYTNDNKKYIQIINFLKHQKPHHTEKESIFPLYKEEEKDKENGEDKEKGASTIPELKNGEKTVKQQLKIKVLDFIHLSEQEILKLKEKLGEDSYTQVINNLNNYIGSTGKRYKSHYFTILSWHNRKSDKHQGIKKWLSKQT